MRITQQVRNFLEILSVITVLEKWVRAIRFRENASKNEPDSQTRFLRPGNAVQISRHLGKSIHRDEHALVRVDQAQLGLLPGDHLVQKLQLAGKP